MKRFSILLTIVIVLLVVVCTNVHAAIKAGDATVTVGSTTSISLAATYQSTLNRSTGISARWSTSSSNVTITSQTNKTCTIKGVTAGTAQVNYYCSYYIDGYYRTMDFYYTVTIESGTVNLTLSPSSITLDEGDTYTVTAYQPGYVGGVYFTSNNSNIASVSTSSNSGYYTYGTVMGVSEGTTYIYAKSATGATSSACKVTVRTKPVTPTSILVLPGSQAIEEGEYVSLSATVSPYNATYSSITWSSSNTTVATVSSSGRVYGKSPGTARITAKVDGYSLSDYCDVTVNTKQVVATSLSADGPGTLSVGETFQLSPVYTPSNATVAFQYASNNIDVVTVSSSGLLTAIGAGTATITITETVSNLNTTVNVEVAEQEERDTNVSELDNVIYIGNVSSCAGGTLTLSVKMKNIVAVQGFGFDLYLPEGVSIAQDEDGFNLVTLSTERTTEKKTNYFDSNIMENGGLRVLASSTGGYTLSGTDGEIVRVTVIISKDMGEGDYPIILREIAISDNNSHGYETDYVKSTLTISNYTLGDVNGDGKINVIDFTAIANYILGKTPEGFIDKAADVIVDNKVNVVDLTAVANIILYGKTSSNEE